MKEVLISIRNGSNRFIYQKVLKKIFFQVEPEVIHDRMVGLGKFLGSNVITKELTSLALSYSNKKLEQQILGINFPNPIGLAAGFDKDAQLTAILPSVGFGFAEVGSITGEPCEGNPKPRLWRLKKSKGLVVYYGLKNEGCQKISQKLRQKVFRIPIGISIAKTNSQKTVSIEAGVEDYAKAFGSFTGIGDYFTINISCPNTYGGQPFTEPRRLEKLLRRIDRIQTKKPIFLKISPDLTKVETDAILEVAARHNIAGFVCTNLTKQRSGNKIKDEFIPTKGGISGKVVEELANNLISYIYQKTQERFIIIGCGGVFSAEDAYKKIKLGASLIQLITGMVFEGPQIISEINQGLTQLIERDRFRNIAQAVGSEA